MINNNKKTQQTTELLLKTSQKKIMCIARVRELVFIISSSMVKTIQHLVVEVVVQSPFHDQALMAKRVNWMVPVEKTLKLNVDVAYKENEVSASSVAIFVRFE